MEMEQSDREAPIHSWKRVWRRTERGGGFVLSKTSNTLAIYLTADVVTDGGENDLLGGFRFYVEGKTCARPPVL